MKQLKFWYLADIHEMLLTVCSSMCHDFYIGESEFSTRLHRLHKYIESMILDKQDIREQNGPNQT